MKTAFAIVLAPIFAACGAPSSEGGAATADAIETESSAPGDLQLGAYDSATTTLTIEDAPGGKLAVTVDLGATRVPAAPYLTGTVEVVGSRIAFHDQSLNKCDLALRVTGDRVDVTGSCKGAIVDEQLVRREGKQLVGTYDCNDGLLKHASRLTIASASTAGLAVRIETLKDTSRLVAGESFARWTKVNVVAVASAHSLRFNTANVVDWAPAVVVRDTFVGGRCIRQSSP